MQRLRCLAAADGAASFTPREVAYRERMGDRGYERFEALKRSERQRVWDNMRAIARERYQAGIMPAWFQREWLDIEEAPTNTWWRQQGLSAYRTDTSWLGESAPDQPSTSGGGGNSGNGGRGGGGGGWGPRWWREEDPYWPLRDWGDHPMRWWTWGLAGVLAAGGVLVHAQGGPASALRVGLGSAALLGLSAVAMSDVRDSALGELGVKGAWATCAVLALRDFYWGLPGWPAGQQAQQHWGSGGSSGSSWPGEPQEQQQPSGPPAGFRGTGSLCAGYALLYMLTGMSGLSEYALPTNPGEAFKMVDVAQKHKIWQYWGYGAQTMRQ